MVFQRDCGATTGFSTQVSIIKADEPLSDGEPGNTYVTTGNPDDISLGVKWLSDDEVEIVGPRPLLLDEEVGDVRVSLKERGYR